jgi:tricorn protease
MRVVVYLAVGLVVLGGIASAETGSIETPDARMLRFPDVSADNIVFVFAGDIWIVPRGGGLARQLSSPRGYEQFPKFSPDGNSIAFSGNYDGNTDVYIMSSSGGTPNRLTHHSSADEVLDWYPDGQYVLYRSGMISPSRRFNRLFKQSIEGGMAEPLPLAMGEQASFNNDGTRIAFQPSSRAFRTWKRYRGGKADDIWLYDLVQNHSEKLTGFDGTDAMPMWHGNTIYFVSDRDQYEKLNIWAFDLDTGNARQVTSFTEYDVKWPSLGPDAIVFENGGVLHLLDLDTEESKPVGVRVPADLPQARSKLKNVSGLIRNTALSPSGKRAVFEARGEIFTLPQEHGSIRNLTNSSGVAERFPAWSPDGDLIAYFSDKSGEYELYTCEGDGSNEKQLTTGNSTFFYAPLWSPDSKQIAFNDKAGNLWLHELGTGEPVLVDRDEWSRIRRYSWSPDSRWLAYNKNSDNVLYTIMIYDTRERRTHQITGDYYDDSRPTFSPDGKYLFFYSGRSFTPVYGDMDATWIYPNSTNIYVATLQKESASPFAPRSDEEKSADEDDDEEGDDAEDKDSDDSDENGKNGDEVEPVYVDFADLEKRVVKVPVEPGRKGTLRAVEGKLVYTRYPAAGDRASGVPSRTLVYFDFEEQEEKTVMADIDDYDLSHDGKKVLYRAGKTYGIIDLAEGKKVGDGKIISGKLKGWINPLEEWRQIFVEAWRLERDYFYDPDMHGVDWPAVREQYESLMPYVANREDLNYVIGEMIGELNTSHSYVRGGDLDKPEQVSVGLLGCDYEFDRRNNLYRFKKIYEGAVWDADVRSPLREPGIEVSEGDYLLKVNGLPVDASQDPWAAFQGLAGEVVTLTVNSTPDDEGASKVVVKPLASELRLRNLAWIESNRLKVDEATDGRIGYVYVPNTGRSGQNELVRQFTPQRTKDGLIIDERFNSGGQIPDRFIELLNRPLYNYWAQRDTRDFHTPYFTNTGPKVMLANQWAGSGGDALPYYFRKAGLGPIVGKRTWGGLIGYGGTPQSIDGGSVTVPDFGFWNTEGEWEIEGYGVDPDYDIENDPHELVNGRDQQLEKAIEVILELLEKNPPPRLTKPAYPDRSAGAKRNK